MAEDNIKDFTINWIIIGLLTFCLISFSVSFIYNNNPQGLDNVNSNKLGGIQTNFSGRLNTVETDSDTILNITANTNPEASDLGSRDSVASAYKTKDSAIGFYDSLKVFIAWIFVGDLGKMLITVLSGIIGFTSLYFMVKWIRSGF